jgi:hypothetical protein
VTKVSTHMKDPLNTELLLFYSRGVTHNTQKALKPSAVALPPADSCLFAYPKRFNIMRKFIIFTLFISCLALTPTARSQSTYTANSCNQSDVNAVINGPTHSAINGDIIQIPAGSCTWTSGITVPSGIGITIIGNGTQNSGPSSSVPGTQDTTITDDVTGTYLFKFQPTSGNSTSRISTLNLVPFSAAKLSAPIAFVGTCSSNGCPSIRADNLTFPSSWQSAGTSDASVIIAVNVFGVLDHNSVNGMAGVGIGVDLVNVNHPAWQGIGQYGDNSWASADTFGTAQALYLENNTFTNAFGTDVDGGDTYADTGGGRFVCRFNVFNGVTAGAACNNHGTESTGRPRGGRQAEFYDNSLTCTNTSQGCVSGLGERSGVSYTFDNTFTAQSGSWFNNYVTLVDYRTFAYFPVWNGCDGTSPYDDNDGTVYYTGTYTGVNGLTTFLDSAEAWIGTFGSSSWASTAAANGSPYSIHNVTQDFGAEIASSSGDGLTFANPPDCDWAAQSNCTWNLGDTYQIRRATYCLDQPSRSGGTLLSGATPSPAANVGEVLDPTYEWGDTHTGSFNHDPIDSGTLKLMNNRDYYYEVSQSAQTSPTSPFNGTVGTGFGTLANRPTTCTPRVAYWATDQGSWNQSGNGGQGELYTCTATNTWTMSYEPYTYPHPLIAGGTTGTSGGNPPSPPTELTATVQ